jgi:hypothetical protein
METKKLWETIQNKRLDELVVELEKLRQQEICGQNYIGEGKENGRNQVEPRGKCCS